jgi:tetratricopeptide (TPR) repeat protein
MKNRFLTAVLLMFTVVAFAQKKEVRRAGKAVEKGEFQEARNYIKEAEAEIAGADKDLKADFYLYKGYALVGTGENVAPADLTAAVEAFKKAKELGHEDAAQGTFLAQQALLNSAQKDIDQQNDAEAVKKLIASYELNPADTLHLYYAANYALRGKDMEKAAEYFEKLKDLNYSGIETQYTAVNKETGEEEGFPSKELRDIAVKNGDYIKPQDKKTTSKQGEIVRQLAYIYIQEGDNEQALAALNEAKAQDPENIDILLTEADVLNKMGEDQKYQVLMEKIIQKDPNNPVLYYNLGVTNSNNDQPEKAIEYYKKAIELDPEMVDAYLNLASATIDKRDPIVEEMNKLGMTTADTKKYNELSKEVEAIYIEAIPYYEKVLKIDPQNLTAAKQLKTLYQVQDNQEKVKEMTELVQSIEQNQ